MTLNSFIVPKTNLPEAEKKIERKLRMHDNMRKNNKA